MSKRFYAACAAMGLHHSLIEIKLEDEDMEEDETGFYIKTANNSYLIPSYPYSVDEIRFKIETSYEHRLVRSLYRIADELLKQE